jgi:membrane protein DedA with SNARE-associated domain
MREFIVGIARALIAAVAAHQYVTLFLAISVEEAGVPLPVPGDLLIAYYGWRAALDPVETVKVILTCALASTVGTQAPYWLSRRFGRRVTERLAFWLDIDMSKVAVLFGWVDRHGFRAVLLARLIPGLRVAVSVVAGTARVPPFKFASGVFVAAAIYWTGWVLLGGILGPHVVDALSPAYLRVIAISIPVAFVGLFLVRLAIASRRRRRRARSARQGTGATSGGTRGGRA